MAFIIIISESHLFMNDYSLTLFLGKLKNNAVNIGTKKMDMVNADIIKLAL